MANASVQAHAPLGATTILHVVDAIASAFRPLKDWNEARLTRRELSSLTDAQLDDIGLTREEIAQI
ncbi:DUF1127 domain-containing protein [Ruegeria sp. 2205SS24-7]|uniref:DUF1127 domain-containing protein n=1 Tax=Ruegeria discodermiae TaxID=3064389 RepID=UPI002740A534|nr:DUF1127 domain-containing protein [Ruegeria sp. 2205SS24-7]MDP5219480.1 DUF1127 domain-containing protein [Ruegeria sp. 2205SS24-7]